MSQIEDPVQEAIIREFAQFSDWMDRYEYLISLADEVPSMDPAHRTGQYLIEGCQSRVWIDARMEDGKLYFTADSDAIITKGLVALLIRVYSGRTPREALDTEPYFVEKIGLRDNLSPTRANGLAAMLRQIRMFALAYEMSDSASRSQNPPQK